MKTIKFGVIGLGQRGFNVMKDVILYSPKFEVVAVCDEYADRTQAAAAEVERQRKTTPFTTCDYREVLSHPEVEAVYVATSWETHISIAIAAMRAGKAVAMEVGGACDLQECYDLVHAWEDTAVPFMMMENCCFGEDELMATAMARAGKFGEIVHCRGAYAHDLREEIGLGTKNRHYRQRHYHLRNADNYPTHDLGPIAKLLRINRGNRMLSLTSVASKAAGLRDFALDHPERVDDAARGMTFAQGDIVTTLIRCAGGETIQLTLDTTLPRFYSREFTVRGTRGFYEAPTGVVFLDGMQEDFDTLKMYRKYLGNRDQFKAQYQPAVWRDITEEEIEHGHGGIDSLEFDAFYDSYVNEKPMPVDVYDAASWMAVTALSEASIAEGGAPKAVPDFTNGAWVSRAQLDVVKLPEG